MGSIVRVEQNPQGMGNRVERSVKNGQRGSIQVAKKIVSIFSKNKKSDE
jgi:hypothetical protein